MKRVNLLTKYSVLYFALLLILFIIQSQVFDISNEALLVFTFTGIVFYIFSVLFIYKEVNMPLKKIFGLSGRLKLQEESDEFNQFDRKISELNELIEEFNSLSGLFSAPEHYEIRQQL